MGDEDIATLQSRIRKDGSLQFWPGDRVRDPHAAPRWLQTDLNLLPRNILPHLGVQRPMRWAGRGGFYEYGWVTVGTQGELMYAADGHTAFLALKPDEIQFFSVVRDPRSDFSLPAKVPGPPDGIFSPPEAEIVSRAYEEVHVPPHLIDFAVPAPVAKHDHPAHYGGKDNPYEAIVVIEAWGASFCGGNALKYICRAGKKPGESAIDDLKKAKWYLERAIDHATALADGAPTDKTSDHTAARVTEAWGLSGALAACVTAIGANMGFVALRQLNDHIITLLETKKEIPAP